MPASGKSTIGVLLAKRIGFDFVDLDIVIQRSEGKTLSEIIADKGMNGFLETEEDYLTQADYCGFVIAPGGSAVYSEKGIKHLSKKSIIIFLCLSLNYLEERLLSLDARGVIRPAGQGIEELFNERKLLYEEYADIIIDCDSLTPGQIVSQLIKELANPKQEKAKEKK
ncbi:MAG: shikimate kinase [Desulfobacteraceae bacterium]|nr:shikimate kinase [Desulfobacteraceae bacterium]